jgi:hypothetical protein
MAKFRVTYATLSADNEELHAAFEEGVKTARSWVGQTVPTVVDGEARSDGEPFTTPSGPPRPPSAPGRRPRGRSGWGCCAGPPT